MTLESGLSFSLSKSFNPHTHVGCDLVLVDNVEMDINSFNPHTHVGCDLTAIYLKNKFLGFNPHTHVGCDYVIKARVFRGKFQSTHPRRV